MPAAGIQPPPKMKLQVPSTKSQTNFKGPITQTSDATTDTVE